MSIDWKGVYQAARRANLAYQIGPAVSQAGFEALGLHWLGIYQGPSHQAVACLDDTGQAYLSISGTRFGKRIGDLIDDALIIPQDLGGGVRVTQGAFDDMPAMWRWAEKLVDASTVWNVEGHSLGGWRARYTPVFLSDARIGKIHSFESPKGANRQYWITYQQVLQNKLVSIVNDRDIFIDWPFGLFNEWEQPPMLPVQWLKGPVVMQIYPIQWLPGFSVGDHSMDIVEAKCKQLAGP